MLSILQLVLYPDLFNTLSIVGHLVYSVFQYCNIVNPQVYYFAITAAHFLTKEIVG